MRLFSHAWHKDGGWFRVLGYGLNLKRTPMLFSERNGYHKYLPLPFGWRVATLTP